MVKCPRCGNAVDGLQLVTADVITRDVIDSINNAEQDLAGEGGMKVCAKCMIELRED